MASNDMEVLESAAMTETVQGSEPQPALSRRQLMAALGIAGAAAGVALFSSPSAYAQQPTPTGYKEADVLNFLLNVKYLTATLYSFVTQGSDLPPTSFTSVGTGGVYNAPGKVTFSTPQITDLFNELFYDELNQLIDLRNLLGPAVVSRQTINLLGNGTTTNTQTSYTESQVVGLARMLEDVSVTAFAGAAIYLSGTNLDYASRVLAADGFHAGALRLISIQTGAQYQSPAYAFGGASTSTETAINFTGQTISGSPKIYATLGAQVPVAGNVLTGVGIPQGPGSVVKSVANNKSLTPTATLVKGSTTLSGVSSVSGVAVGQPVTGTNIAAGTYVAAVGTNTITLSTAATGASASQTVTIGASLITIAGNATATGLNLISVIAPDNKDVEPGDQGDAATAAKGPQLIAGTSATPAYQGFFNTAGSGTANANAPAGFAFTRNFSEVLAVLLNTNSSNSIVTSQNYQGGFYPVGVSGTITAVA